MFQRYFAGHHSMTFGDVPVDFATLRGVDFSGPLLEKHTQRYDTRELQAPEYNGLSTLQVRSDVMVGTRDEESGER